MTELIHFKINEIFPDRERVLNQIGVPSNTKINDNVEAALERSLQLFETLAKPVGVIKQIFVEEFAEVFNGEGKNETDAVLKYIYPNARNMALFALTMGPDVSAQIHESFATNDFPIGSLLDAASSVAADNSVMHIENIYFEYLNGKFSPDESVVLSYSPGYCGWDLSGQKKLFDFLDPGKINISLSETFLMSPIKSVTGILIAGKKEIHKFDNKYKYCRDCRDKSCRERIDRLMGNEKE